MKSIKIDSVVGTWAEATAGWGNSSAGLLLWVFLEDIFEGHVNEVRQTLSCGVF